MYKLFSAKKDSISSSELNLRYSRLPESIKLRINAKKSEDAKTLSVLSYSLAYENLDFIGAKTLNLEGSRPVCDVGYVSLAHSRDASFCVLSDHRVGVDAETIRDFDFSKIVARFSVEEQQYVSDDCVRFFKVWTMKEAFAKLSGDGIGRTLGFNLLDMEIKNEYTFVNNVIENNILSICIKNKK